MKQVILTFSLLVNATMFTSCVSGTNEKSSYQEESTFEEVIIGEQIWMLKNLDVEKFRNGDLIPEVKTDEEWIKAGENKQPAWCYYDNDSTNGVKYGKLYNWYAVNDSRGLAPDGWHVSSREEWNNILPLYRNHGKKNTK